LGGSTHTRGVTVQVEENNLAVLIDFENIAAGTEKEGLGRFDVETLMQRVKDKGRILVARSYADWGRFSRFKQSLLTANVTMMELTSHGMQDKNRADIAMVVDALELAFTKDYIHTFVVVSGDSDFTPLVLKMRELDKRVIGIGTRKSTSRLLIQACDEFMFYDTVVQPKSKRRKVPGQSEESALAFALLEEALDGLQRENPDPVLASVVKSAVLRKSPDFNENELGFSSFARFLEAAQEAGVVRVVRDTKSGGYRVDAREEEGVPNRRPPPVRREREPEPTVDSDLDADLDTAEEEEVNGAGGSDWVDEYLPQGTEMWVEALEEANLHPFGAPTRLAVLQALEDVVSERSKKRRKTTLQYVLEDVKKKLRRTHPSMPDELLKGALDALMRAGELMHRDGTAIRSSTAPFTLQKDAEELNESLVRLYLAHLREAGCDLSDTALLAELMYGDSSRKREIETTLAYLGSEGTEPVELDDVNLDDLLIPSSRGRIDVTQSAPPKPAPSPLLDEDSRADSFLDDDSLLMVSPPPEEVEEAPKKRRAPAKKKPEPRKAEARSSEEVSEEAPKRSRRPRKKAEEDDLVDLDSLLEPS
jgi:uncharacterized LabA/DUF88 family protein